MSTPLRCGACGTLALCSLACARAAWPEHRSGCSGALAERKDESGDWLPAPAPVVAVEAPARTKHKGEAPADEEASEAPPHAGAGKAAPAEEEEEEEEEIGRASCRERVSSPV